MRYVQICERCGRVFPREENECPKCHLKINSIQPSIHALVNEYFQLIGVELHSSLSNAFSNA